MADQNAKVTRDNIHSLSASQHQHNTPTQHTATLEPNMREEISAGSQVVIDDEKEHPSASSPLHTAHAQSPSPSQPQTETERQHSPSQGTKKAAQRNDLEDDARFVCNICLDPVCDAVVTVCGHLYCWPCLFRWLNIGHTTCPVCKAGVTKENVIPLYLQGGDEDPRVKHSNTPGGSSSSGSSSSSSSSSGSGGVPNRPSAQRPVPQPNTLPGQQGGMPFTAAGGVGGGGMAFSAGLGFFPSLFGLQFQNFAPPPPNTAHNRALTPEEIQQQFVSQSLLMLGIFVLFCLLLV